MSQSNDVYAISGRIKNLLAIEDLALSPIGTILINAYTLVLKDLHDFSEALPSPYKEDMKGLLIQKEDFPLKFIKLVTPKEEPEYDEDTIMLDETDYEEDEDESL